MLESFAIVNPDHVCAVVSAAASFFQCDPFFHLGLCWQIPTAGREDAAGAGESPK